MEHRIRQYRLEQGALEVEYMEQMFTEFAGGKKAVEIIKRLEGREHLIVLSMAPSPEDPDMEIPVAFKVGHELSMSQRLVGSAHNAEANMQIALLHDRGNDGVERALAGLKQLQ